MADDLNPDDALRWLLKHAAKRSHALFIHALDVLHKSLPEAARIAGYSGGKSSDPDERNRQLSSAGSRALQTRAVQNLREEFDRYQAGELSDVADRDELMRRLTSIARQSKDSAAITAAKQLLEMHKTAPTTVTRECAPDIVNAACQANRPALVQALGLSFGIIAKRGGMASFSTWQVPNNQVDFAATLDACDPCSPMDFVKLLRHE